MIEIEGQFSGRGVIHSTKPPVSVEYSIEVWIERREANTMGGSSTYEGLLDMTGTIKSDDDLFDVFRESNPSLELEDGRRIGSRNLHEGRQDRRSSGCAIHAPPQIRLALRPLLPRVVAPLEGRSSGFRIYRSCAPSRPTSQLINGSTFQCWKCKASGIVRRSSPVTATGSRRICTGFPQVEVESMSNRSD